MPATFVSAFAANVSGGPDFAFSWFWGTQNGLLGGGLCERPEPEASRSARQGQGQPRVDGRGRGVLCIHIVIKET